MVQREQHAEHGWEIRSGRDIQGETLAEIIQPKVTQGCHTPVPHPGHAQSSGTTANSRNVIYDMHDMQHISYRVGALVNDP